MNTGSGSSTYNFQVGAKEGQTIGITLSSSDGFDLAAAGNASTGTIQNTRSTPGQTVKGNVFSTQP